MNLNIPNFEMRKNTKETKTKKKGCIFVMYNSEQNIAKFGRFRNIFQTNFCSIFMNDFHLRVDKLSVKLHGYGELSL